MHVRFLYLHDGDDVDALKPENSVNGETHAWRSRVPSGSCQGYAGMCILRPQESACYLMLIARGSFRGDIATKYRASIIPRFITFHHARFLASPSSTNCLTHARRGSYLLRPRQLRSILALRTRLRRCKLNRVKRREGKNAWIKNINADYLIWRFKNSSAGTRDNLCVTVSHVNYSLRISIRWQCRW